MVTYCHSVTVLTRPVFCLLNSVLPVVSQGEAFKILNVHCNPWMFFFRLAFQQKINAVHILKANPVRYVSFNVLGCLFVQHASIGQVYKVMRI